MPNKEFPPAVLTALTDGGLMYQDNLDPRFKTMPTYKAGIAAGIVPQGYDHVAVEAFRDGKSVVIEGSEANNLVKGLLGEVLEGGSISKLQREKLNRLIDDALDDGKFNHSNVMNMPKPSRDEGPSR